jgi:hypothetical protein
VLEIFGGTGMRATQMKAELDGRFRIVEWMFPRVRYSGQDFLSWEYEVSIFSFVEHTNTTIMSPSGILACACSQHSAVFIS